jgi:hypothetical protein
MWMTASSWAIHFLPFPFPELKHLCCVQVSSFLFWTIFVFGPSIVHLINIWRTNVFEMAWRLPLPSRRRNLSGILRKWTSNRKWNQKLSHFDSLLVYQRRNFWVRISATFEKLITAVRIWVTEHRERGFQDNENTPNVVSNLLNLLWSTWRAAMPFWRNTEFDNPVRSPRPLHETPYLSAIIDAVHDLFWRTNIPFFDMVTRVRLQSSRTGTTSRSPRPLGLIYCDRAHVSLVRCHGGVAPIDSSPR